MKKLVVGLLVVVLLLLATSVVSAAQPSGVDAAVRVEGGELGIGVPGAYYKATCSKQYSNGVKGHSTFKCKLELENGSPQHQVYKYNYRTACTNTISLNGKKGMFTSQCFGDWYP